MSVAPPIPHPLPPALVELIAQRFRVIGEPMRIRLLDALRDGPMTVNELTRRTRRLPAERLQARRRARAGGHRRPRASDGNHVRCSIADPSVFELCELVCGGMRRQVAELDELLGGAA